MCFHKMQFVNIDSSDNKLVEMEVRRSIKLSEMEKILFCGKMCTEEVWKLLLDSFRKNLLVI